MDQVDDIVKAAESARAEYQSGQGADHHGRLLGIQQRHPHPLQRDLGYIIVMTLIVVFLILAALLRAVVAPIYLVLSVVLSFVSAMGIGVVFFQFILVRTCTGVCREWRSSSWSPSVPTTTCC